LRFLTVVSSNLVWPGNSGRFSDEVKVRKIFFKNAESRIGVFGVSNSDMIGNVVGPESIQWESGWSKIGQISGRFSECNFRKFSETGSGDFQNLFFQICGMLGIVIILPDSSPRINTQKAGRAENVPICLKIAHFGIDSDRKSHDFFKSVCSGEMKNIFSGLGCAEKLDQFSGFEFPTNRMFHQIQLYMPQTAQKSQISIDSSR
jgi:hypothetical protein